jgi:ketosteroid isomerase-like protein
MTARLCDGVLMANLTAEFYACLDDRDYEGVLRCLTPDAVWVRRAVRLAGRDAISKAMHERPADFHTRHLVTNVRVQQTRPDAGTVTFYMVGLPHVGPVPEGEYVPVPQPHILNVYRDTLARIDGHWLITEKIPLKTAFKDGLKLP